mmetsp:Transcript_1364/g.3861  ORF Transcript_1364/g.3861 Transcript_1364/m.3861 type:complete len:149 (-) Transcript_1364:1059-1505(-)
MMSTRAEQGPASPVPWQCGGSGMDGAPAGRQSDQVHAAQHQRAWHGPARHTHTLDYRITRRRHPSFSFGFAAAAAENPCGEGCPRSSCDAVLSAVLSRLWSRAAAAATGRLTGRRMTNPGRPDRLRLRRELRIEQDDDDGHVVAAAEP